MTTRIKVTKTINGKETFLEKPNPQAKIEELKREIKDLTPIVKRKFNEFKRGITEGKKLMIDDEIEFLEKCLKLKANSHLDCLILDRINQLKEQK